MKEECWIFEITFHHDWLYPEMTVNSLKRINYAIDLIQNSLTVEDEQTEMSRNGDSFKITVYKAPDGLYLQPLEEIKKDHATIFNKLMDSDYVFSIRVMKQDVI